MVPIQYQYTNLVYVLNGSNEDFKQYWYRSYRHQTSVWLYMVMLMTVQNILRIFDEIVSLNHLVIVGKLNTGICWPMYFLIEIFNLLNYHQFRENRSEMMQQFITWSQAINVWIRFDQQAGAGDWPWYLVWLTCKISAHFFNSIRQRCVGKGWGKKQAKFNKKNV